jgi:hypothetical protein
MGVQPGWFYFNPIEPNGIASHNNDLYPHRDYTRNRLFKEQQCNGDSKPIAISRSREQ